MGKYKNNTTSSKSCSETDDKSYEKIKSVKRNRDDNIDMHRSSGFIGPMTDNLINSFIQEMGKKKNKEKIMKNVVDPLLCDINDKYYPYMMTLTLLLTIIIVLLISLLAINSFNNKR